MKKDSNKLCILQEIFFNIHNNNNIKYNLM